MPRFLLMTPSKSSNLLLIELIFKYPNISLVEENVIRLQRNDGKMVI